MATQDPFEKILSPKILERNLRALEKIRDDIDQKGHDRVNAGKHITEIWVTASQRQQSEQVATTAVQTPPAPEKPSLKGLKLKVV